MAGLIQYFLTDLPAMEKSISSNTIFEKLKEHHFLPLIHFLISVASILSKYLLIFQKDEPLIHILHTEYVSLLQQLMGRFLKASYLLLKLPLTNIIIRCCKVLQPSLRQEVFILKGIWILGKRLLVSVDIDSLSYEWKLYQLDDISLEFFKTKGFNENGGEI